MLLLGMIELTVINNCNHLKSNNPFPSPPLLPTSPLLPSPPLPPPPPPLPFPPLLPPPYH